MATDQATCPACGAPWPRDADVCPACGTQAASQGETEAPVQPHASTSFLPEPLPDFRIVRVIGQGGMGTVYEAWQQSMRRPVALKILDGTAHLSQDEVSRFEREAWIGGRLNHPNIVKVFGQGSTRTVHWIAMELIEGSSLHAAIAQARRQAAADGTQHSLPRSRELRRMVELFVGVAEALHHVHQQGIVHRDIKPLNLLMTTDGARLLLSDFGLARDEDSSRLTRRGDFLGTIRYMSPEQLLANRVPIDHRSDLYSLGVSLYEALTLALPYSGDTEEKYIRAVSTEEPLSARRRNREVPRDLETILLQCLARDPRKRYESAEHLAGDLRRWLDGRPVLARRPGPFLRAGRFVTRHRWPIAAAALAAIAVTMGAVVLSERATSRRDADLLRWTLEQVISTGNAPTAIQPNWEHLSKRLDDLVRRDPRGPLAALARRASVQVTVALPTFALLADLPSLEFEIRGDRLLDRWNVEDSLIEHLREELACVMDLEVSWDDGPLITTQTQGGRQLGMKSAGVPLSEILQKWEETQGPHRLAARPHPSNPPSTRSSDPITRGAFPA